jgi:hypothetical protein
MRTLSILLCSLLVLAPAKGQQTAQHTAPNFFVSYGVRDAPAAPLEEYSSSGAQLEQPYEIALAAPNGQMQRRYPAMRGPRFRQYGPRYGLYRPQPEFSTAGVLVTLGLITSIVGLAIAQQ